MTSRSACAERRTAGGCTHLHTRTPSRHTRATRYSSRQHPRAMLLFVLTALSAVLMFGECNALPQHMQQFESELYTQRARADPDAVFHLAIGLHVRDFDALERKLWEVSRPHTHMYGQHLSRTEADALARPHDGALDAVQRWLQPFVHPTTAIRDIGTFSPASNILKVALSVEHVERLLQTTLHEFELHSDAPDDRYTTTSRRLVRAAQPITLPLDLHRVVAFVNVNAHPLGLRALASMAPSAITSTTSNGGTLAKLRALYRIPNDLVVTNARNTQCVPSFYTENYNPDDLRKFFNEYLPGSPTPRVIERGTRQNDPTRPSTEASLDVQYITGVARNATTFLWTMNGSNPFSPQDEPFVEFVESVLEMDDPPLVVSISYSDDEAQIYRLSPAYARTFDALLIKMGLRGISVLVASGDDGVAGLRPEFAKLLRNETCTLAGPQWPSSSPYITSVGATMLLSGGNDPATDFFRTDDEVVCSGQTGGQVTSGGGFSNVYAIPTYQQQAVARYLATRRVPSTPGFFNRSGRAYPDIAALGASFHTYIHGYVTAVSGTSASTPVIGAMVTLWNDARLNAGKRPLGFLNPLLYYLADNHPAAFHDVVVGNNGARRGGSLICPDSFGAAGGWDAATGVGTPNFPVILDAVLRLDDTSELNRTATKCVPIAPASGDDDGGRSAGSKHAGPSDTDLNAVDDAATTTASSVLGTIALVAVVAGAAAVGVVLLTVTYKRWRNQYTSLSADVALRDAKARSTHRGAMRAKSSSVASPGDQEDEDDDAIDDDDDDERVEVELSEISLHE